MAENSGRGSTEPLSTGMFLLYSLIIFSLWTCFVVAGLILTRWLPIPVAMPAAVFVWAIAVYPLYRRGVPDEGFSKYAFRALAYSFSFAALFHLMQKSGLL